MKREEYLEIIKETLLKAVKKSFMEAVIKRLPFLALPVINPILGAIVGKVLEILLNETELRVSYLYTDFRVNQEAKSYIEMANGYKNGTVKEKDLIDSFRKFVKLV
jgi:hypothetical protein